MKLSATLANCAWLAASLPSWQRFRRALHDPEGAQSRLLGRLLRANAASAFGRAHRFAEIRDYADFCARVPLAGYAEFAPWLERIRGGESAVLTGAPVTRLVPTSGSTSARKLIPFTAALQGEFNAAIGPWMVDLFRQHPGIALGPAYWSITPAQPPDADDATAVPIGFDDDSAYLGGLRQRLAESTFAAPSALRLVTDPETHRYLTLLCLLRQPDLRLVSIWHPSLLVLLFEALPAWWSELLEDVARGGCRRAEALPSGVREAVASIVRFPARPSLARRLRGVGPHALHALWPRLRLVSCWGDGQAALPFAALQQRLPRECLQAKGLLATEAFVSIPFHGQHPVAVRSHFYEFADESGVIVRAHQLQLGQVYRVIVTTGGGLWRYRLGDEVEVDGFCGRTPSLRFLGRGSGVSDLCGEKLAESFVTAALDTAFSHAQPVFAMLAPETDAAGRPHYTLFVQGEISATLLAVLETELAKNPHYAHCRRLGQLGPLRSFAIAAHAFAIFCRVKVASGRRLGEIKPQALSARADWRQHFGGELAPGAAIPLIA